MPTIPLTLCVSDLWFAYQNEGGPWARVTSSNDMRSFVATERLAIASARLSPESPFLRVDYLTAAQASALYACRPFTSPPAGRVSGIILGLAANQYANITYGGGSAGSVLWTKPDFSLYALPGANDLIAIRHLVPDGIPDRMIIRRAQTYPAGSNITLDFASDEAFAPASNALSWNGPTAHVQVNHRTAQGNDNMLQSTVVGAIGSGVLSRTTTLYSIPAARQIAGDVHQLDIGGSDYRAMTLYYREPRDRVLTFGPSPSQPTLTTVATSPSVRLRVDMTAQAEYDGRLGVTYVQPGQMGMGPRTIITMMATKEYFSGTPGTWSLTVPDLSGVDGFGNSVGLKAGEYAWYLHVTSNPLHPPLTISEDRLTRSASLNGLGR